jgi:hypothetical protein
MEPVRDCSRTNQCDELPEPWRVIHPETLGRKEICDEEEPRSWKHGDVGLDVRK